MEVCFFILRNQCVGIFETHLGGTLLKILSFHSTQLKFSTSARAFLHVFMTYTGYLSGSEDAAQHKHFDRNSKNEDKGEGK